MAPQGESDMTAGECRAPQSHGCNQLLAADRTSDCSCHHYTGLEYPFFLSLISNLNSGAGVEPRPCASALGAKEASKVSLSFYLLWWEVGSDYH